MSLLNKRKKENEREIEFLPSELILNPDGSVYHLNLKPEHVADTIIAVGDPGRVHRISTHFDNIEFEMMCREFITHTGTYKGRRLTVMSTGMGTDNIEIFMNELDALANIDLEKRRRKEEHKTLNIIRIGTSGSLQDGIPLGSHLVSRYAVGLDTLMTFYCLESSDYEAEMAAKIQQHLSLPFTPYCVKGSDRLESQFGFDMVQGNTVTCPGFYAPQGRKLRFELRYPDFLTNLCRFHEDEFWLTNFEMETAGYYALGKLLGHEILSVNAIIANRITNEFATDPKKVVDDLIQKILERV